MTSFDAIISVFNIIDEKNSLSTTTPGHWKAKTAKKAIDKLLKLLGLRSQNDIELHVEQFRKKKDNFNELLFSIQS